MSNEPSVCVFCGGDPHFVAEADVSAYKVPGRGGDQSNFPRIALCFKCLAIMRAVFPSNAMMVMDSWFIKQYLASRREAKKAVKAALKEAKKLARFDGQHS